MSAEQWAELKMLISDSRTESRGSETFTEYKLTVQDASGAEIYYKWVRFSRMLSCFSEMKARFENLPALPRKHRFGRGSFGGDATPGGDSLISERCRVCANFLNAAANHAQCRQMKAFSDLIAYSPKGVTEAETPPKMETTPSMGEMRPTADDASSWVTSATTFDGDASFGLTPKSAAKLSASLGLAGTSPQKQALAPAPQRATQSAPMPTQAASQDREAAAASQLPSPQGAEKRSPSPGALQVLKDALEDAQVVNSAAKASSSAQVPARLAVAAKASSSAQGPAPLAVSFATPAAQHVVSKPSGGSFRLVLLGVVALTALLRRKSGLRVSLRSGLLAAGLLAGVKALLKKLGQSTTPTSITEQQTELSPLSIGGEHSPDSQQEVEVIEAPTIDVEALSAMATASEQSANHDALLERFAKECTDSDATFGEHIELRVDGMPSAILFQKYTGTEHGGEKYRTVTTFDGTCDDLKRIIDASLSDIRVAQQLDPNVRSTQTISSASASAPIVHRVYSLPGIFEPCEVMFVCVTQQANDGTLTMVCESIDLAQSEAQQSCKGHYLLAIHATPAKEANKIKVLQVRCLKPPSNPKFSAAAVVESAHRTAREAAHRLQCALSPGSLKPPFDHSVWEKGGRQLLCDFAALAQSTNGFSVDRSIVVKELGGVSVPVEHNPKGYGSLGVYRAETVLEATVEELITVFRGLRDDLTVGARVTPGVKKNAIVEHVNAFAVVIHKVDAFPFPLKNRDYVFISMISFSANGSLYCVQRSLPFGNASSPGHIPAHPSAPRENEKLAVRAQMYITGFRAMPLPAEDDKPPRIKLMQLVDINAGGNVPARLVSKAMDERAHTLGRIQREVHHLRNGTFRPGVSAETM